MKRIFSLLVVAILVLAGCGNKGDASSYDLPASRIEVDASKPGWSQDTDTKATLKWFVGLEWYTQTWGVDLVSKEITERTGKSVEIITGSTDTLNTMLASGDIPDIVTVENNPQITADMEKIAVPLTVLADAYSPYYTSDILDPDLAVWYANADGEMAGFTPWQTTPDMVDAGQTRARGAIMVRKDIYEGIGSPDLSTPEAMLAACEQVKAKYEKDDLGRPLSCMAWENNGSSQFHDGFVELANQLAVDTLQENGNANDILFDDEMVRWYEAFNQMYQAGYIEEDTFLGDTEIFKNGISNGHYFMFLPGGYASWDEQLQSNMARNSDQEYIWVEGPRNTENDEPQYRQPGMTPWITTYVTNKAEDPQSAFYLLEYLQSFEGQVLGKFGIENETFTISEDGTYEFVEEVQANLENPEFDANKEYGFDRYFFMTDDKILYETKVKELPSLQNLFDAASKYVTYPRYELDNTDPDGGTNEARNFVNIKTKQGEIISRLIKAKDEAEFDAVLAEYKEYLASNGWDEIQAMRLEKIKSNLEKVETMKNN